MTEAGHSPEAPSQQAEELRIQSQVQLSTLMTLSWVCPPFVFQLLHPLTACVPETVEQNIPSGEHEFIASTPPQL